MMRYFGGGRGGVWLRGGGGRKLSKNYKKSCSIVPLETIFFFAGVLVVNFVLPLEIVTPEWRTFCGCIGLWAVGLMALALWGYFIRDWQYLVIATSTASVFILLAWW